MAPKKVWKQILFTPVFHCCFWIWDTGSGMCKNQDPQHWGLGCLSQIQGPGSDFFNPVSWIQGWQDPGSAFRSKNASIFNLKIWSRFLNLDFCPSWIPGSKKHWIHNSYLQHCIYWCLKTDEVCKTPYKLKWFDIRFSTSGFFYKTVSPWPLSILLGPFQIFPKICGDIDNFLLTMGK